MRHLVLINSYEFSSNKPRCRSYPFGLVLGFGFGFGFGVWFFEKCNTSEVNSGPAKKMDTLSHVDVVIIGGGWTGLVMAKEIASRTSQSVVVLERGGPARSNDEWAAGMDEVDGLIRKRFMHNIADSAITHRHSTKSQTKPIRQIGGGGASYASGVGGSGELWSAVVSRFLPEQFELATHLRKKYGADKLPPDLTIQDWGMTYDEIEPYYWRAEQMLGVGGKAGNIRGIIEGGNIFEGPSVARIREPASSGAVFFGRLPESGDRAWLSPVSAAFRQPEPTISEPRWC